MESDRYHRQILLPHIGQSGQARLGAARVLLVGCGALGSVIAEQLVRAGVGLICLVDRDLVEWTNLQRQVLYGEEDARQNLPKAVAAAKRLGQINSSVRIEPLVLDLHAGNLESLWREGGPAGQEGRGGRAAQGGFDLLLDGTDNIETRYLVNDLSVKHGVPWVYGACVGTEGRVMAIRPPETACLRCIFPEPPRPGELATCDTAGVLGPAAGVVASLQAAIAIKLLSGNATAVAEQMLVVDLWADRFHAVATAGAKRADCPCCGQRRFEFLDAVDVQGTASLCGRNAVQIRPSAGKGGQAGKGEQVDLTALSRRLAAVGWVERTAYFLRCVVGEMEGVSLTIFPDGRVIVSGTDDPARARSIAARYVGM